ncbi:MAG: tetratricopeptide repeat protein [Myxococcota bacterium]
MPPAQSPSLTPEPELAPSSEKAVLAEDQRVPLRLTAQRGALGLELYEAVELGPLRITALTLTLTGLNFPLDLSGGVPKFRHRRGELEHVTLQIPFEALGRWIDRRVSAAFESVRPVSVYVVPGGLGLGMAGAGRALAFELLWAPTGGDARLVISNARGVGFDVPALAVALRVVSAAFGRLVNARGRSFSITAVGRRLGRVLLPAVGARVPAAERVRFGALASTPTAFSVELDSSTAAPELSLEATRALELAELLVDADQHLADGAIDAARKAYVTALENAPRHPEIVRLVAEIDARVNGRAEAALGLLVESLPATQAGLVGAELLVRVGDPAGARQAVEQALREENFAPLAALSWLRLAEIDPDIAVRIDSLDRAVARAPGLAAPRWARFALRVERGDLERALSDAEHLEALESGARARHDVCRRAARVLLDAGHVRDAGRLFERALRYLPDDAAATAGLARSLQLAGRATRALVLFERAVELSERSGHLDADALIDLARMLAEHARDLPQAVVRLRQVTAASERVVEARYLEGVYRARLGDRVGAALAFARMREAIELAADKKRVFAGWLLEAAEHALSVDDDAPAAERHLTVALRIAPNDERVGKRFREVSALVAERARKR